MKLPIRASLLAVLMALMAVAAQPVMAQSHHGYHRFHVWRNDGWVWEYHPANWVIPTDLVGPSQVDINLGWSSHPGWQSYKVYRHNRWSNVYHPSGWQVPGAWRGTDGHSHDRRHGRNHDR